MRLTNRTDYAFRVLMYLAVNDERLATVREIADHHHVSCNYLKRVVWELGRAGFVKTMRGKGGGLRLACPAETIPVGAVVRHMERAGPLAECFPVGAGDCRIAPACRYRAVLAEAKYAFFVVMDRYSVHDLVDRNPELLGLVPEDPPRADGERPSTIV